MKTARPFAHVCWVLSATLFLLMGGAETTHAAVKIDPNGTLIQAEDFTGSENTHSTNSERNFSLISASVANRGTAVLKSGGDGSTTTPPTREIKTYELDFTGTEGVFYLWALARGDHSDRNSFFFTINSANWKAWRTSTDNVFAWTNAMQVGSDNTMTIAPGTTTATLKIGMREDDSEIDAIFITKNSSFIPSGESGHVGFLTATPDSVGASAFVSYNAGATSLTITNNGTGALTSITLADDQGWLTLDSSTLGDIAPGASRTVGMSFVTGTLTPGTYEATITISSTTASNSPLTIPVTLLMKAVPVTAACGEIPLYAENLVNPAIMVQLDTSGSMSTGMPILKGGLNPHTPDLKTIVQEIVSQSWWDPGDSMLFKISGSGKRRAWSYDGQPLGSPKLTVAYTLGTSTEVVEQSVSTSAADAQMKSGSLNKTESYLELGRSGDPVGLQFNGITIPKGATIVSADIEFLINSGTGSTTTTNLEIRGSKLDDAELNSDFFAGTDNLTDAKVAWSNLVAWNHTMPRIDIAEDVLKEVFLDRSISWGFATWAGGGGGANETIPDHDYTNYRIGVHDHDEAHQIALQDKADDGSPNGWTPLAPTMQAALEYFTGTRSDNHYKVNYKTLSCQPKIVVIVTDGLGNTGTTIDRVKQRTRDLAAAGISVVAVGFGLDNATQLKEIAAIAQAEGKKSEDDKLYALHDEDSSGNALPFMAQSREGFIEAMNSIVTNVKAQIFHGSAPAPTTSVDDGELLLTATFDSSDWSGNLKATRFDPTTGKFIDADTSSTDFDDFWSAKNEMPATGSLNCFIYDATSKTVGNYADGTLAGDNYLCKPLGDIINSTPKIVGRPPYIYDFNNYKSFKYTNDVRGREALVYVNANDGALHAFSMKTGAEKFRYYPDAVKTKLSMMTSSPQDDICSTAYCHKFINDGSPTAADIYDGTKWRTVLASGIGMGGKAFYSLDITYGKDFSAQSGKESLVLWEFSESDDAAIGLGTAIPEIERVTKDGFSDGAWVTYFGSGPELNPTQQDQKEAYLFAVGAHDKRKVWKQSSASTVADTYKVKLENGTLKNDVPSPPLVLNAEGDDYMGDRIYLGNRYGNLYRVNTIGEGEVPVASKLFDSAKTNHATPVIAKPGGAYARPSGGGNVDDVWVYFGTGRYEVQADKTSQDQQYFFGLYDPLGGKTTAYTMSDLAISKTSVVEAYAMDKDGNKVDINKDNAITAADMIKVRTVYCDAPHKDATTGLCNVAKNSWAMELFKPGGTIGSERVVAQPLVVSGVVFFTSFIPDGDVCAGNGDAYLMALDWQSGSAKDLQNVVFDINRDGRFDPSDATVVDAAGNVHAVIGVSLGDGKPSEPVLHNDIIFVGTTGMPPVPIKVNLPGKKARLKAWRQSFNP